MKHFCSFSEAIREGAKLRPQAFGQFFLEGSSCALAAGYEAIFSSTMYLWSQVSNFYPYLNRDCDVKCPAMCGDRDFRCLADMVPHLNDCHQWTREEIADWLEREEEKLGFVTLVESESPASRPEMSLSPQPVAAQSGVRIENRKLAVGTG